MDKQESKGTKRDSDGNEKHDKPKQIDKPD